MTKSYSSAVGAGEFVSEIFGEEARLMRDHGGDKGEYGATTGRPRRMGWFDCVAKQSQQYSSPQTPEPSQN